VVLKASESEGRIAAAGRVPGLDDERRRRQQVRRLLLLLLLLLLSCA
jgi:hypothetical protein